MITKINSFNSLVKDKIHRHLSSTDNLVSDQALEHLHKALEETFIAYLSVRPAELNLNNFFTIYSYAFFHWQKPKVKLNEYYKTEMFFTYLGLKEPVKPANIKKLVTVLDKKCRLSSVTDAHSELIIKNIIGKDYNKKVLYNGSQILNMKSEFNKRVVKKRKKVNMRKIFKEKRRREKERINLNNHNLLHEQKLRVKYREEVDSFSRELFNI